MRDLRIWRRWRRFLQSSKKHQCAWKIIRKHPTFRECRKYRWWICWWDDEPYYSNGYQFVQNLKQRGPRAQPHECGELEEGIEPLKQAVRPVKNLCVITVHNTAPVGYLTPHSGYFYRFFVDLDQEVVVHCEVGKWVS